MYRYTLTSLMTLLVFPVAVVAHDGHDHAEEAVALDRIPTWVLSLVVVGVVVGLYYLLRRLKVSLFVIVFSELFILIAVVALASTYRPELSAIAISLGFFISLGITIFGAQAKD